MLPCKHVFCLDCAKKYEKVCPRCESRVQRIEQSALGTVFICTHGAPKHSVTGCRRTYLSKRDLQAHIAHRHSVKASSTSSLPSGEDSKPSLHSHHQQQHLISSSSLYDRHESRDRERDRDRDRDRERDRDSRSDSMRSSGVERARGGEQAVHRPIEGPPPNISTAHPPPPMSAVHLQHPPPPASSVRHPPTLHVQHPAGQLRIPMGPIPQAPPLVATTMESYVTVQVPSIGGNRTNQNLITVPIQDEGLGADSYHTSRRGNEMASYVTTPHSVAPGHPPTGPPPAGYSSTPPPHMGMPPPGPFSSANLVGRIPFNTAPQQLAQAVAQLTHALSQQQRGVHPQRMAMPVPVSSAPPPTRFPPNQPPYPAPGAGSPMHWSGAPPPRQAQPPPRHQPPPTQRPPSESTGYNQYY